MPNICSCYHWYMEAYARESWVAQQSPFSYLSPRWGGTAGLNGLPGMDPKQGGDLEEVRRGGQCPRCGGRRVSRWGRFSGGQRFRCRDCGKTFSSQTGRPQAYSKYQERWSEMESCLRQGLTLRETAQRLGIHLSTAFRWRHRLLADVARRKKPVLHGIIEMVETFYPDCRKGERNLGRPARRRREASFVARKSEIFVVLAVDRHGGRLAEAVGSGIPGTLHLGTVLWQSLDPGAVLCTERFPWYKRLSRWTGLRQVVVRDWSKPWIRLLVDLGLFKVGHRPTKYHIGNVTAWRGRLRAWLAGFRGVGAKYLPEYLAWFRSLDCVVQADWAPGLRGATA